MLNDLRHHRISTARKEKGWVRHFFHQIESNWPLPYSTKPVPRLKVARPAGWVTYCRICESTMPRAQNRAAKGSILLPRQNTSPDLVIIYLCQAPSTLYCSRWKEPTSLDDICLFLLDILFFAAHRGLEGFYYINCRVLQCNRGTLGPCTAKYRPCANNSGCGCLTSIKFILLDPSQGYA